MKNAIIFHGTECKPEDFWYQSLKANLESRGFMVELPHYPTINRVPIAEFVEEVLKNHQFDAETVLVGHSSGSPLILALLERINVQIAQAVLVAGYSSKIGDEADPILQPSYDWAKIKANNQDFVVINSTNDPWGCDDKQGRAIFDQVGGTQIIKQDGHFGSITNNQPYEEFPLLEQVVGVTI